MEVFMKTSFKTRLTSILLALMMMLPVFASVPIVAAESTTYTLNASSLSTFDAGAKRDGSTDTAGTDNFFTIHWAAKSKIDTTSNKTWEDGYGFTSTNNRINFQEGATLSDTLKKGVISFTTQGSATVKIWIVAGEAGRQMGVYDSTYKLIDESNLTFVKNDTALVTLNIPSAGTYYVGGTSGNNYIVKMTVETQKIELGDRPDWSTVSAPVVVSATRNEIGKLSVSVNGAVGHNGADYMNVNMYDKSGKLLSTVTITSAKSTHEDILFSPASSDEYTFKAELCREGEDPKVSAEYKANYVLPLEVPFINNCANLGDRSVRVVWNEVKEAESYCVYVNGAKYRTVTDHSITINYLTVGREASIKVQAIRGTESSEFCETRITVGDAEVDWNYVIYGPSTKASKDTYTVNSDGSVTLISKDNGGKLQPTGADGLGFYYTAVPADQNFTFRAKVKVNSWLFTNGQEGFGLMVTDHVPSTNDNGAENFWTNQYMAAVTKIEYRAIDNDEGFDLYPADQSIDGTKYTMKLGIGAISKTGIDQSIIDRTALGETGLIVGQNGYLKSVTHTLEWRAARDNRPTGSYNIIGNYDTTSNIPEGNISDYLVTELILEIEKNNTGYFISYYDKNGELVRTIKNYEPDALQKFDEDFVYVGMFTSRNANITFTDISLTTRDAATDAPAEERPITQIIPSLTVTSPDSSTSTSYEVIADTNLNGTIDIRFNGRELVTGDPVIGGQRYTKVIDISNGRYGIADPNSLEVVFNPDPNQKLPEFTALSSTAPVKSMITLTMYKGQYHRKTLYVSPDGLYSGTGSKDDPYDIYTAVKCVIPGQTIVLMEGTYRMEYALKIQRGINGTEEAPIRMIADPEAKTRPVLDFLGMAAGITHGGNWWYFYGFDVTRSLDGSKGFQVSGNNNILDNINTYHNGNTGIQISRYAGVDITIDQWPANNLILNCTSYGNADSGYEDADGFAAKLTIGEGNVFDGCVAYNNADDGWDLYAKVATGSIGAVVIKNCVAYGNGYLEDGTNAGNGNGFKMGGDSLSGKHQLINSIAFNNKAKGIDSNSCPDIIVKNCISYNNGSYNVAFYTNGSGSSTNFVANGIISIKDSEAVNGASSIGDNLKPQGNQDNTLFQGDSNYYWSGTNSSNASSQTITTDIFVSTEFKGITRNEDGTINMNGFLELKDTAPEGSGTTGESTPSIEIALVPDIPHEYTDEWYNDGMYYHWQECECGDRTNIGEHTFEYVTDKEPTATKPGYKHNECTTCGYKMPAIEIPALGSGEPTVPPTDEPVDTPDEMPSIFEDFLGFWAWLWRQITNFFTSIFGGKS